MARFTKRANGEMLATVTVKLEINRDVVRKIMARLNCNESQAMEIVRDEFQAAAQDAIDWRDFCLDHGAVTFQHVDDIGEKGYCYQPL